MAHLYDWFGLNIALFHLINGCHAHWWDGLMLAMTWLGDHDRYPVYVSLALLVVYVRPQWLPPRAVAIFAAGYLLTTMIVVPLKPLLDFPRPLLALGQDAVVVVGAPEFHHSFPSGHATFAVLLAASLSLGAPRAQQWALGLFALLVCISRISVGAHFPADVLGGAVIALATVGAVTAAQRVSTQREPHS